MTDSPRVWTPGRRLLTVGMVLLITIAASESLAISTVMPLVESELGDLPLYGWVFSAFFLGNVVGIIAAGHLADRFRPVLPLAGGLVLFVTGLLLGAGAASMPMLVGARAVQGLGAGAIPAVANVCVARAYSPAARPRMFALFSTAWIVPGLVGPSLASQIGEHLGWRYVFSLLVPLALAAGIVTLFAVRPLPGGGAGVETERPKVGWTLGLVVGSGCFLAGLTTEWRGLGVVLVVIGAALAGRALGVLWPPGVFRARPGLPACVAAKWLFGAAFFGTDVFVPLALTDLRGASVGYAGLVVSGVTISWTAASWVAERLVRTIGPRPLVRIGFLLVMAGAASFGLVVLTTVPIALAFPAWMVAGAGAGSLFGAITAAGLTEAEPGHEGSASSSMLLADTMGISVGTGVAGAIVAFGEASGRGLDGGLVGVFVLSVALALTGGWVAGRLPLSVLVPTGRG